MCGIFCSVSRREHVECTSAIARLLDARGPDARNTLHLECRSQRADETTATTFVTCCSTVLSLRGDVTVRQPYREEGSDATLCWNGEAWSIDGVPPDGNDTAQVYQVLEKAAAQPLPLLDARGECIVAAHNVSKAMSRVAGPYAFIFSDPTTSRIFFARDFLGRRSLLYRTTDQGDLLFSSVADARSADEWSEVEADGIYCIDLSYRTHSRDISEVHLEERGNFFILRSSYLSMDAEQGHASVIPRLALNRELPSAQVVSLDDSASSVSHLDRLLRNALAPRVLGIPEPLAQHTHVHRSKLAVLFSGGLDCTTLARLCHDLLPISEPIDLLNVAFENPRVHKDKGLGAFELCPDRVTGRASYAELVSICSGRAWRFVAINISYSESQEHRQTVIDLMHPHNTEMDLSIAFALYFAARGSGVIHAEDNGGLRHYTTSARVLLSGLGADELFAGYTRHATAYRRNGFTGLLDELDLDIGRLGKRNLGRDDRVISHWSREVRLPFLDEALVGWALAAPVTAKCGFGSSTEHGVDTDTSLSIEAGKKVLRCLAWKLGMKRVARERKRAIQFGARTAKMEAGNTKGTKLLS